MAELLLRYYKYMADEQGLEGKMRLATETRIPSSKAAMEPDSSDNVAAFRQAIEKLTGKPAPSY
jgi:hypothetical protein